VPFTSHKKLHKFGIGKPISWAKPAYFDILTINFTVWSDMLNIGGDILKESPSALNMWSCTTNLGSDTVISLIRWKPNVPLLDA